MYYKLSNTALRTQIEEAYNIPFCYPKLHVPEMVICGINEVTLPIITCENPEQISFAIWGMLPTGYKEDWKIFQSVTNTLNVSLDSLTKSNWQSESFFKRRCLVVVNGFFTSYLHEGRLYPYYLSLPSKKTFLLAGIYNITDDGFLSFSLILGKAKGLMNRTQNMTDLMPLIVDRTYKEPWLDLDTGVISLKAILNESKEDELESLPIPSAIFNENIPENFTLELV